MFQIPKSMFFHFSLDKKGENEKEKGQYILWDFMTDFIFIAPFFYI